LKSVTQ